MVTIWPWVCHRSRPDRPLLAELRVCEPAEFPEREYNPSWLAAISAPAPAPEPRPAPEPGRVLTGKALVPRERRAIVAEYARRLRGLVSPAFHERTILTVGLGAGSYAVEKLARLCPRRLRNCDFDVVERSNLSRTVYTWADAESRSSKVDALARRLAEINPAVEVESVHRNLLEMSPAELDALFDGADLAVAGTDSFEAQALINELAARKGIPALFVGIHSRGEGGRIVWTVPGETGCYRCASADRFAIAERQGARSLDLASEAGSIVACQLVDMVALQICLAVLERRQRSHYGRFFEGMRGRNEVVVRCHPDYGFGNELWDAVLGDLPKEPKDFAGELRDQVLFAADALWLRGDRDPACPVCGSAALRRGK
jgi:hypothetical protein